MYLCIPSIAIHDNARAPSLVTHGLGMRLVDLYDDIHIYILSGFGHDRTVLHSIVISYSV